MLVYLALAGALAAALAALAAALMSTAAILSEDVVHGLQPEMAPDSARIATTRVALLGAAFVTAWLAIAAPADPFKLFLWSLSFSASAVFPVLVLSIWWKRINAWGAMVGMLAGLGDGGAGHPAGRSRRMAVAGHARWSCRTSRRDRRGHGRQHAVAGAVTAVS